MAEPAMRPQRRGQRIAMSDEELQIFLSDQRTCRVATVGVDGAPHVSALWFVWDGNAMWLNSLVASQRWVDVTRDPRVAVVVDTGEEFTALRGVELLGAVEVIGDVPRTSLADDRLDVAERLFGEKYAAGRGFTPDGRHAWLRLQPDKVVSWDFRKLFQPR